MSLVNVSIVGNIVKPPEQVIFSGGRSKTTLIMGVKAPTKLKEDNMDFYKIEAWGKLGEIAHKYVSKGNQVGVSGRLLLDRWQDKEGKDRVTPVVQAHQISLPPKLRVVTSDESSTQSSSVVNPIGGEVSFHQTADTPSDGAASTGQSIPFDTAVSPSADPDEEFDEFEAALCASRAAGG